MRLRLLLLVVPAALLAGCAGEPYTDSDLTRALSGVDHVVSAQASCSDADLSWECRPSVDLAASADAQDVAAAITKVGGLTQADRDEATVTVGRSSIASGPRGATVTFTSLPPDVDALAAGMLMAQASDDLDHASFTAREDGMSIQADFVSKSSMETIAAVSRSLLDTSGATSISSISSTPSNRFSGGSAFDAWPTDELAVLEAVRAEHPVEGTVVRKGFLSILLNEDDDVGSARALATAQPGYSSIETVLVTDDPEADLFVAGDTPVQGADMAGALGQQPGYLGVRLGDGSMRIGADSLDHAEAMDAMLQQRFAKDYARRDTTYEIEGVATVERPAGTVAWFDTARALVDSGQFTVVDVGDAAPREGVRVVFARAADGVTPADAAETIARTWKPGRKVEVKLGWQADPPATLFFTAGDTISIDPSARIPEKVTASIEQAWARGRAAAR